MHYETDYSLLLAQSRALIEGEPDSLANVSNLCALLFQTLDAVNWAGVYLLRGDELVLGPFQGQNACVRIAIGAGVCGTAVAERRLLCVDDVHQFDGHIACDAASQSEIVVPLIHNEQVLGVLDIDSPVKARFSAADERGLAGIAQLLTHCMADHPQSVGLILNP